MPEVINSFRGDAQAKAQVERWIIVSAEVGDTWTATVNRKEVTYTLTQDDIDAAPSLTADQVAMTNLLAALLTAAEDIAEFNEMTYESDDGDDGIEAILVTGPSDGKPFTATISGTLEYGVVITTIQHGRAGVNEKQYVSIGTVTGGTFTLILLTGDPAMPHRRRPNLFLGDATVTLVAAVIARRHRRSL